MSLTPATRQLHHFEDLSPERFEHLVYWLVKRSGEFDEVQWYGGARDKGRDVVAYKHTTAGREKWYIQCKRHQDVTFATLRDELDKLAEHTLEAPGFVPHRIVFATATTPSPHAKDEATAHAQELGLPKPYYWGRLELDERLKAQPETEKEFFGRAFQVQVQVQSLHQIPPPPSTFKGRQEQLDELTEAIRDGGVAISGVRGMGGIGKTALALKLAQRLAPDYPYAQIFVDLKGTTSPLAPSDVMGRVIHAFHPKADLPASESERYGLYRSVLHGKNALMLLDDAAGADQVEPLIPPKSCALLVTSRQRFRLPGMRALDLNVLGEDEARELLCHIAPRIGDAVGEIAELCGYLPLALELAAKALAERKDIAPAEYAERLRDERRRLDLVDASLSLSYDLLDERLRRLWARLSVFSIPFDREAAAVVWGMEGADPLDALGELLRYSLVDWREKPERYDLHDLARLFAYRRLQETEDPRPVHGLAAEYLSAKITDEERGGTPGEALEAVDQWERAEAWERFARRASALVGSLDRVGYWEEIEERLRRALKTASDHLDEPELEARLLSDLGIIAYKRAEWDRAIEMYEESLETKERVGDVHGMAQTFNNLGLVYADKGEWGRAIEMYKESLETFERVGDVRGMAQAWGNLGLVYAGKEEWDRAVEYYQRSLEVTEEFGDRLTSANQYINLGSLYLQIDQAEDAKPLLARAYLLFSQLGSPHANTAAQGLVEACGSVGAANAYLAKLVEEDMD
jgi:tetratricopeptide (TPR) repeat protein